MIGKFLETFFRHKLLIILPMIIIPVIVGPLALLTTPVYYETWAGIWVDRAPYLSNGDDYNIYLSPAQNQSNRLNEALRTRSFVTDVAKRTSLAPLLGTARGEDRAISIITDGISLAPSGNHLLVLRFRGDTAKLSYELLNAIVDAFTDKVTTDRGDQAALALGFYESRLQSAEDDLKKLNGQIRQYIAANPRLGSVNADQLGSNSSGSTAAAAATDPQLADMLSKRESQRTYVDRMRASLDQAQLDASAADEGSDSGFRLLDAPRMPTGATRELRKRLIFPVAGLAIGMALSMCMLVLLVASDRAVRTEDDLGSGVRVLGAVPRLKLIGKKRRGGPETARRAIGFAAGAALPAPRGGA